MSNLWKKYHIENDKPYKFTDVLKKEIEELKPDEVLEIGCGYGRNLEALSSSIRKYGMDFDEDVIREANERNPQIFWGNINLLAYPFNKFGEFELVFTCLVLQHLDLSHIDYVLKNITSLSSKYVLFIEAYDKEFKERPIQWHRKITFNTLNLIPRLEEMGLKILKQYPIDEEYYFCLAQKQ